MGFHKGDLLAYYYMNESAVATYPLVNITDPIAVPDGTKYPMAGQKSHYVNIHVYNVTLKKYIVLEAGSDTSNYLTNVTWSPDEKLLLDCCT